jgi:hypothetical protein
MRNGLVFIDLPASSGFAGPRCLPSKVPAWVLLSCFLFPRPTLLVATKDSTAAWHIRSFVAYPQSDPTPVGRQMRSPAFVMDGGCARFFVVVVHRLVRREEDPT